MRTNLDNLQGKKVLIVGLARTGIAVCQTLLDMGAIVSVHDAKAESTFDKNLITFLKGRNVKCYFEHIPEDMSQFDMLILSPGVTPELGFIQDAAAKGVEITGEIELAYRVTRGHIVGITGTNGKTTTTTLVGEIFKASGRKTHVVGNIGTAAIADAAKADEQDWLITEVSSFQLETTKYFKPQISAILNLTPDHLNRHHTMEAYGAAKAKIFENQTEANYLIINYDDKNCYALCENCKARIVPFSRKEELAFGAFVRDGKVYIKDDEKEVEICNLDDVKIIGDHNVENILAASAIAYFAGIESDVIGRAIIAFAGVEHRIEYVGMVDDIMYYNDSKGTNVDAAVTAIKAIKENIILIAGGDGKAQDFDPFIKSFNGAVKKMVLLGRDAQIIADAAEKNGFTDYVFCKDMPECVRKAAELAEPGDTVLLSPACASWDMYDNFEQRGDHFKECVEALRR